MATTRISDIIVPEVYGAYTADKIVTKSNIIQSGAFARDGELDTFLRGGGSTYNKPIWDTLLENNEGIASDDPSVKITPQKATASKIIVPRCVRTNAWEVADLDVVYNNADPMAYIASQDVEYKVRLLQDQALSVVKGVFANNALATDTYHTKDDMRLDISGSSYVAGTTDFSASALIDACATMGDYQDDLSLLMVHPVVYANMKKQQLIDVLQPATVGAKPIPMYGNAMIIVNSKLPANNGVYSSYAFGANQFKLGFGVPKNPIVVDTDEKAGNGYGVSTMISRWINAIAPNGFSFVGTVGVGGPENSATTNNFANANSWQRVVKRENVKMVELVTRES